MREIEIQIQPDNPTPLNESTPHQRGDLKNKLSEYQTDIPEFFFVNYYKKKL